MRKLFPFKVRFELIESIKKLIYLQNIINRWSKPLVVENEAEGVS